VAVLAAVLENIGYRQLTAWWRVRGTLQALRSTPPEWGEMTRTGFSGADDESPVGAASGAAPGRRRAS
jgi:hypothetical protein